MDHSDDREERITAAIEAVEDGQSLRAAAADHGIPYSTLSGRKKGCHERHEAQEPQQRFSAYLESLIAEWIIAEEAANRAPTKAVVQKFAEDLLQQDDPHARLGVHWIDRFINRHKDIASKLRTAS